MAIQLGNAVNLPNNIKVLLHWEGIEILRLQYSKFYYLIIAIIMKENMHK